MQGTLVLPLVRELRSHLQHGAAKKLIKFFKNHIYIYTHTYKYTKEKKTVTLNLGDEIMNNSCFLLCSFVFFQLMSMDCFYAKKKNHILK